MSNHPKKPGYNWNTLARVISEVLDLRYDDKKGPAYEILKAMIHAIENGLKRGEDVKIQGFGIFRLHTRPAARRGCTYFYGNLNRQGKITTRIVPAKTYVQFKPSKVLLRMLNENP